MNTDRIEQLLEKYWLCTTTVEEEKELRTYFLTGNLPPHLQKYKPMFELQAEEAAPKLNDEFDERILNMIRATKTSKPKRMLLALRPVLHVAAAVIVILALGFSVKLYNRQQQQPNPWAQDTYASPEQALAEVQKVFGMISNQMEKGQELVMEKMEKTEPLTRIIRN